MGVDGVIRDQAGRCRTPHLCWWCRRWMTNSAWSSSVPSAAGASGFRAQAQPARQAVPAGDQRHRWAGQTYVQPDRFSAVSDDAVDPTSVEEDAVSRLSDQLTAQQSRILQLICEGKLNKQIAFDLSIAETTVKAHITAILRKLGVHSRTQAVLMAQNARFAKILQEDSQVS